MKRDYAAALKARGKGRGDSTAKRDRLSARAAIDMLAGDAASAHEEIESARALVEARLRERPDDLYALIQLSWIYVGLQRNSE